MNDEQFDDLLREAAGEYNVPPPIPTERMWERIQTDRQRRGRRRRFPPRAGWWWPVAAAALLILGVGIGRLSRPDRPDTSSGSTQSRSEIPVAALSGADASDADTEPVDADTVGRINLYSIAAGRYLGRTEAMLTAFRNNGHDAESFAELSGWARDLLVETRLLLDSPAVEDPSMNVLLVDLEVVLAEIVQMSARRQYEERPWIEAGLDEKSILLRLQMTKPAATRPPRG
jgi:hypothetical protein